MGPTYSIRRLDRLEAWFDAHSGDETACRAMKRWIGELMRAPREVCTGEVVHQRTGRPLYFASVPDTDAMVTYLVGDTPVRLVTIVSVIPAP